MKDHGGARYINLSPPNRAEPPPSARSSVNLLPRNNKSDLDYSCYLAAFASSRVYPQVEPPQGRAPVNRDDSPDYPPALAGWTAGRGYSSPGPHGPGDYFPHYNTILSALVYIPSPSMHHRCTTDADQGTLSPRDGYQRMRRRHTPRNTDACGASEIVAPERR